MLGTGGYPITENAGAGVKGAIFVLRNKHFKTSAVKIKKDKTSNKDVKLESKMLMVGSNPWSPLS